MPHTGSLRAALLVVACLFIDGGRLYAEAAALEVWLPNRQRSPYGASLTEAFIAKLEQTTAQRVHLNASVDMAAFYAACARYAVDHAVLSAEKAAPVIANYGYRPIAYGEAPIALYARSDQTLATAALRRIGYMRGWSMDKAVRAELPAAVGERELVAYASNAAGIEALFRGEVDGLLIRPRIVDQLAPTLRERLVLRRVMRTPGRAVFLVSPRLDAAVAQRLQALYLSDDAFIRRLYFELGGMARIVNANEVGELHKP